MIYLLIKLVMIKKYKSVENIKVNPVSAGMSKNLKTPITVTFRKVLGISDSDQ